MSNADIIDGMADEILLRAVARGPRPRPIPTGSGHGMSATRKAARELADLYENSNDASLDELQARSMFRGGDAYAFGEWLVKAAMGAAHIPSSPVFVVPTFRAWMDGRTLNWEGEVPDDVRLNPGDWDRDSARGYGRYEYRMERTLSQALAEARQQGIPERLMSAVQDGWAAERADTVSGGYIDPESNPTKPKDYTMREASEFAGKESHTFGEVPHTKSLAEVRNILARIKRSDACSDSCPGWAVFDTNRGFEIQVCDDCMRSLPKAIRLSDADVAQLPEAQRELRKVQAEWMEENPRRRNPSSVLTDKGERMYEDIKRSYEARGESRARAEELAMRTVYARAADGVPGLVRRHGRPPGVPNGRRAPAKRGGRRAEIEAQIADNMAQRRALIDRLYYVEAPEDIARIQHAISELEKEANNLWSQL